MTPKDLAKWMATHKPSPVQKQCYSVADLARETGLSRQTIQNYLTEKRKIPGDLRERLKALE
jgi:lambda repressor-like predicted transcriptional regulator